MLVVILAFSWSKLNFVLRPSMDVTSCNNQIKDDATRPEPRVRAARGVGVGVTMDTGGSRFVPEP